MRAPDAEEGAASARLPQGWRWREICASEALREGGLGVRFDVRFDLEHAREREAGGTTAAFAVRSDGVVRAYVNRCSHRDVELDWMPGRFFDDSGLYLVCATHGAEYRARDGGCAGGPCAGRGLERLTAAEFDGAVWVAVPAGND